MKFSETNETLTLYLEGRIDSSNVAQWEAEANEAITAHPAPALVLDCSDLLYISSAGLRMILRMAKKEKNMKLIQVSRDVYEILEMTGFADMLNVTKALRKLSVDGCPIIGKGAVGTIYRYDDETVLKVYRPETPMEELTKERERSQIAFVHGIPTAISYDIVQVGDCYGLLYELVPSGSMGACVTREPERAEEYAVKFAEVLKLIHELDVSSMELPDVTVGYARGAKNMSRHMTEQEYELAQRWLDAMPKGSTLLHGDFHPKNIMVQNGEPLLIDMGDICLGHPLYDIAIAYFVIMLLPEDRAAKFSGIPRAYARRFWDTFMRVYFETDDPAVLAEKEAVIESAAWLRMIVAYGISNSFPQDLIELRMQDLRERAFPRADELIERLKNVDF